MRDSCKNCVSKKSDEFSNENKASSVSAHRNQKWVSKKKNPSSLVKNAKLIFVLFEEKGTRRISIFLILPSQIQHDFEKITIEINGYLF